jgi:hypothetical protein
VLLDVVNTPTNAACVMIGEKASERLTSGG